MADQEGVHDLSCVFGVSHIFVSARGVLSSYLEKCVRSSRVISHVLGDIVY
jgi:hypothetical protein